MDTYTHWERLLHLLQEVRWLVMGQVCKYRGHNMRCYDSYCTPDSGGESFECKRCGYCYDVTYY